MSLQFIFGNSGSGKSDFLYDSVLKQAKENKEQQFLIIVPEQFTMQTQRELVERQKQHAIMNVDVLSFARLAYRVFDDLGKQNVVVLEETGKVYSGEMLMQAGILIPPLKGDYWSKLYHVVRL